MQLLAAVRIQSIGLDQFVELCFRLGCCDSGKCGQQECGGYENICDYLFHD